MLLHLPVLVVWFVICFIAVGIGLFLYYCFVLSLVCVVAVTVALFLL